MPEDAPAHAVPVAGAPEEVVDWGASPWTGPRTAPDAAVVADSATGPGRRRRTAAAQDAALLEPGSAEALAGAPALPAGERRGRRRRERGERTEPPAPSTRRRAAGSVGRRTVSSRPARDLGPDDDAVEVARQVCLDQLSYTARTRAELATALDHRGVPAEVAEQVLERFTEVGLIDDEAFAAAWVTRRSAVKGLARRALTQELRQRGVADDTAQAALDTLDPEAELEHARALVDRRLASTASAAPDARVRRLVGMLARKGYPAGLAYRVVRDALAQEGVELAEADST